MARIYMRIHGICTRYECDQKSDFGTKGEAIVGFFFFFFFFLLLLVKAPPLIRGSPGKRLNYGEVFSLLRLTCTIVASSETHL